MRVFTANDDGAAAAAATRTLPPLPSFPPLPAPRPALPRGGGGGAVQAGAGKHFGTYGC